MLVMWLMMQSSSHSLQPTNILCCVDAAELFSGCDTKLPVIQQYRSSSRMARFGRAVSVCALVIPSLTVTFFHQTPQMPKLGQIPSWKPGQSASAFLHFSFNCFFNVSGVFFVAHCFTCCASHTSHVETVCPVPSWTLLTPSLVLFTKTAEDLITSPPLNTCLPELYAFLCQLALSNF